MSRLVASDTIDALPESDTAGYRFNERKVWAANAAVIELLLIFAATEPGIDGHGVSAFHVERDAPDIRTSTSINSLGVRRLDCRDIAFEETVIGLDAIIWSPGERF